MKKQMIHQGWQMREAGTGTWIKAQVPGSVYADLLRAGAMEDPFWKDNEEKALAKMEKDYIYRTVFVPEAGILEEEQIRLRFDGLDTLAQVSLNGKQILEADNMHCYWEVDVKDLLQPGENELQILFSSPTVYIRKAYAACRTDGSSYAMPGFPQLRKAHCMFGWDWGPRLPDAGIWRPVYLCGYTGGRIGDVLVRQCLEGVPWDGEGTALLRIVPHIEHRHRYRTGEAEEVYTCRVTVKDPEGRVADRKEMDVTWNREGAAYGAGSRETGPAGEDGCVLQVDSPRLWWPNGYGGQPLYTLEVVLCGNGVELDTWNRRIGIRTMTMERRKDQWGESFAHQVNGTAIFAMGADYIPEDNILSRTGKERTRKLLQSCKEANFNTIRVWGGGYYPEDWFYDLCDEMGLVVWQDFMFACAVYDLNQAFEQNITRELIQNIIRLRHHACLGLWSGNNEMEQFVKRGTWVSSPRQVADYIKMYEYIFPKLAEAYAPDVFYWPSSPSSGGSFDDPESGDRGDVHYWDVWHGDVPFSAYRNYYFRYLSEFGFQSFPRRRTIETFTDDGQDMNIFSYVMEKHQRNGSANGKIVKYLSQVYLYPTDFDTLLYASQLLQADAIRYGVEHFRRNRGRCMGAVYWQLNDIWPVASWSSIDYCGRYKALQYYAGRFFAPVLLSCEEESLMTQNADVNALPYEVERSIRLNVSNETRQEKRCLVKAYLRDADSAILKEMEWKVQVPSLQALWLEKVELPQARLYQDHVSYELYVAGEDGEEYFPVSSGSVLFCLPKHYRFQDPHLALSLEGDRIMVHADCYARGVDIQNKAQDLVLSDNDFDMEAGSCTVRILRGSPEELTVRSVYDIR